MAWAILKNGVFKVQSLVDTGFNQVGDYLGVSIRGEPVAVLQQVPFQFQVVLNNPVMHNRHPEVAISLRMGIGVGRAAMGGPTGVAQPGRAPEGVRVIGRTEAPHFADRFAKLQLALVVDYDDPGAIISSVLQPLESFKNDRPGGFVTDVPDYAAQSNLRLGRQYRQRRAKLSGTLVPDDLLELDPTLLNQRLRVVPRLV